MVLCFILIKKRICAVVAVYSKIIRYNTIRLKIQCFWNIFQLKNYMISEIVEYMNVEFRKCHKQASFQISLHSDQTTLIEETRKICAIKHVNQSSRSKLDSTSCITLQNIILFDVTLHISVVSLVSICKVSALWPILAQFIL